MCYLLNEIWRYMYRNEFICDDGGYTIHIRIVGSELDSFKYLSVRAQRTKQHWAQAWLVYRIEL